MAERLFMKARLASHSSSSIRSMLSIGYQYQDCGTERDLRKRQRLLGQVQSVCPHIVGMDPAQAEPGHTAMKVDYAFETFVGTLDYFCMFCRARWSEHAMQVYHERMSRTFYRDPNGTLTALLKDKKQADKLIQKLNRLGGAP